MDGLTNLYPQLSVGGFLIVDDYGYEPCRQAVADYRAAQRRSTNRSRRSTGSARSGAAPGDRTRTAPVLLHSRDEDRRDVVRVPDAGRTSNPTRRTRARSTTSSPTDVTPYASIPKMLALSPERRARIRVYAGHLPYVASELLGFDVIRLTLLRDPVDRTVSMLKHVKRLFERYRELSLEEIYDDDRGVPPLPRQLPDEGLRAHGRGTRPRTGAASTRIDRRRPPLPTNACRSRRAPVRAGQGRTSPMSTSSGSTRATATSSKSCTTASVGGPTA